jgi:phosphonate transport system ATP-binding protein
VAPGNTSNTVEFAHVQVANLTLARGGRLLVRDLNFAVPRGSFVALVGPSGIGKSTLLESLGGLLKPVSGSIIYRCNQDCLHTAPEFRHRIGFVFQQLHLARNATVLNNVLAGALSRYSWWRTLVGFPKKERDCAHRWLSQLGLEPYASRMVRQLSGGEQQRVALARTFLREPELILADEPVAHLDASMAERVLSVLRTQAKHQCQTVLCVLHDEALVRRFSDAILRLGTGKLNDGQWAFTPA